MKREERKPTGILCSTQALRQLILDNPDLPLLVFAGEEANSGGDYSLMCCTSVRAYIGEFLDCCQTVNDERVYTDRDDFQEALADNYYEFDGSDKEFEEFIEKEFLEYEPYWKKCIILSVDN